MSLCADMNPPWVLQEEVKRLTAENEKLRAALSPFASTKTDDGYDYISSWPDTVIVRIEASVREMKAARAALEETSNDQA